VVGVTGDLTARYLAELSASLRTPPERTAEIVAEAQDHLRESVAAGLAIGMTAREAQEAAISAFGPVRAVVRAHRRPASVLLAEVGTAAMRLAGVYLLALPCTGLALLLFRKLLVNDIPPAGVRVDLAPTVVALAVCLAAGLALLAGYRTAARRGTRGARWRGDGMPAGSLGGHFPMVAALSVLAVAPLVIGLHALRVPGAGFQWAPGLSAIVANATFLVAAGYTIQMLLLARQRTGVAEGESS
jgi:hypothetical protein